MANHKQLSYSRLTDYIESMIAAGKYRGGDKLPTLRELSEKFELNLDTVRRGLWHLRDKGLVECRRSSGVFVNAALPPAAGEHRIAVMLTSTDLTKTYCAHVLLGMQQAALSRRAILEVRMVDNYMEHLNRELDAVAEKCDAVVLLGNYDIGVEPIRLRRPAVGVEMHRMYGGVVSTVSLDPVNAAELAADYFRTRGVGNVKLLTEGAPLTAFRARLFFDRWTELGGEVELIQLSYRPPADFSIFDDRKTGYLFSGGELFQNLSRQYREKFGGPFNADRIALSIDGKSRILPGYDPVDTIGTDWPNAGKVALDEALRRIGAPGSPAQRIYLNVNLELKP